MNKIISERVESFRSYMNEKGLDAFIVVSSDPHSSEYVADRWKCREWLSGFDGSAGTVVVTADKALLWTDSRYWFAAEKLLAGTGFELMKDGLAETPSITEWLCGNLENGDVVGMDATVCSVVELNAWRTSLASCGIAVDVANDPFEVLWNERPTVPLSPAQIMPTRIFHLQKYHEIKLQNQYKLCPDGQYLQTCQIPNAPATSDILPVFRQNQSQKSMQHHS